MPDDQSINLFERAQQSPLFQLSLSSKEIFHRNLIAWLIQADPSYAKAFANWLSGLLKIDGASDIRQIEREKNNIDLSFKWDVKDHPETVHIELKVKSLPLVKQLRDYAEKKPADRQVLISASMTPSIHRTILSDKNWSYIPFHQLSNLVERLLKVASTPYHQQLLLDYLEVIPIITRFAGNNDVTPETHYGFHKAGLNPNLHLAQRLGLRDLYLKNAYSHISNLGHYQLTPEFGPVIHDKGEKALAGAGLVITAGFTNSQGMTDFAVPLSAGGFLGIQLQGEQFRYYIEGDASLTIPDQLLPGSVKAQWFESMLAYGNPTLTPAKDALSERKFGSVFRYRYLKIRDDASIQDLLTAVRDCLLIARRICETNSQSMGT